MGIIKTTAANIQEGDELLIAGDVPVNVAKTQTADGKIDVTLSNRGIANSFPSLSYEPDQEVAVKR